MPRNKSKFFFFSGIKILFTEKGKAFISPHAEIELFMFDWNT